MTFWVTDWGESSLQKRVCVCGGEGIKGRGGSLHTRSPAASSERRQMAATFPFIRRAAQTGTALLTRHQPYPIASMVMLGSFTLVSNCSRPLTYKPNFCKVNCEKLKLWDQCYIWQRHLKMFAELIHRHPFREGASSVSDEILTPQVLVSPLRDKMWTLLAPRPYQIHSAFGARFRHGTRPRFCFHCHSAVLAPSTFKVLPFKSRKFYSKNSPFYKKR